jgi:hypothetical protein
MLRLLRPPFWVISGQAAGTSRSGLAGEAATGEPPKKKKRGLFTNPTKVVLLKVSGHA